MGGSWKSELVLVLATLTALATSLREPGAGHGQLEEELDYRERENEAVARLYENVLDALQCRSGAVQQQPRRRPGLQQAQPVQDRNWRSPPGLGQVSGVAVDPTTGRPVVFHRGEHSWDYDSFDEGNRYAKEAEGPIRANAVLALNAESGAVEEAWGSNAFYLPHGIHVDRQGNVWLTDVALHQVFKFPPSKGQRMPSLVLGERFEPGSDARHFCQPTAVATAGPWLVVADGYCNDRVLVFDAESGRAVTQLPSNRDEPRLRVPHSLAVLDDGEVCVADRDHQRVVCFELARLLEGARRRYRPGEGPPLPLAVHRPGVCRIFGITAHGKTLYGVNGPTTPSNPVVGFTLEEGSLVSTWGPSIGGFKNPHDIAACPNGTALYVSEIGPNVVWKFRLESDWEVM